MDAFKVLHILSMFAAVTLLVGEALLYARVIWRSDVAGLAAVRRLLGGRPLLGVSFFIAGIVFGLLAAVTGGFEFFAGWLIAACADCGAVRRQWIAACAEAAADRGRGDGGNGRRAIAEEVADSMTSARRPVLVAAILNIVLFAAIITDMIVKPF